MSSTSMSQPRKAGRTESDRRKEIRSVGSVRFERFKQFGAVALRIIPILILNQPLTVP
jgi:hypothetical protein